MSDFYLNANDSARPIILGNMIAFCHQLPDNKSWHVKIELHTKDYTAKQRRSIFGPAYKALMEFSGLEGDDDKRELHRFMCCEFFGSQMVGHVRKPLRTTTKNEQGKRDPINIETGLRFYAFLQRKGAEIGCYVPDPDPFWREQREAA